MTLSMDDDLDMSMRAPYISMSESSELPLLISDDLMWGAQPDIKQTLNITTKKIDDTQMDAAVNGNSNQQQFLIADVLNKNSSSSSFDSSLTSLLCNQFLQQHQQQQQLQNEQTALKLQNSEVVIRVIDDDSENMENSEIGM
jgi:hypothetical protein